MSQLSHEIRRHNIVRASFEAAWLAHALVDGLTPAHHYPYEEKLLEVQQIDSLAERDSKLKKVIASEKHSHSAYAITGIFGAQKAYS